MARVRLPESKLKARRRKARFVRTALFFLLFFVVVGGLVGASWLPQLRVGTVMVQGAEGVQPEIIEAFVSERLRGSYFFLFPKNNILLYPKEHITKELLKAFPALGQTSVYAEKFTELTVQVEERRPVALWCGASPAAAAPCLLMDARGTLYEPAADFSGPVYVAYYGATSAEPLPRQYLAPEQYRTLAALVRALEEAQAQAVVSVWVDEVNDVHVRFENSFELLFVFGEDAGDVYERFTLALTAEPFAGRSLAEFEYLDLRFGDRLYYKLKEE